MKQGILWILPFLSVFLASCGGASIDKVFFAQTDSLSVSGKSILYDFNGEISAKGPVPDGFVLCRQQQLENTDCCFAVLPEDNYVGIRSGELEIRLLQHQVFQDKENNLSCNPMVYFGKPRQQKLQHVNGGLAIDMKGNAVVTALRFADNDTLDRLWGNFIVRQIGTENQRLLALSSSEGDNTVWIDCPLGVQLSPDNITSFVAMLPPGAFYRGFSLDVFSGDSLIYHIATEHALSIERGKTIRMPAIEIP